MRRPRAARCWLAQPRARRVQFRPPDTHTGAGVVNGCSGRPDIQMGAVEGALRGDGGGEQRLDALGLQHRLGLLGFGALQFRLRQRQAHLHRAHASLQLIAVALVDQGRGAGLENGHDLAGRDIFPDPVADAQEPPGHGRGDDVHITYPGAPFVPDRDRERARSHLADICRHGPGAERQGQQENQDDRNQRPEDRPELQRPSHRVHLINLSFRSLAGLEGGRQIKAIDLAADHQAGRNRYGQHHDGGHAERGWCHGEGQAKQVGAHGKREVPGQ